MNGQTYYYRIAANWNRQISKTIGPVAATPRATQTTLSTPTGLTTRVDGNTATVKWLAVSGATSYTVYRSTASTSNGSSVGGQPTTTELSDPGLTYGTTYYYRVAANGPNGSSAMSSPVSVTPAAAALAAPTGLTAVPGDRQITLTWNAVAGTNYALYRSTTSGGTAVLVSSGSSATAFTDMGLTNGATYFYKVNAYTASGPGPFSQEVSATPVAPTLQSKDFRVTIRGPHHVAAGYSLLVLAEAEMLKGEDDEMATPRVSGLPSGVTVQFVNIERYCCGTKLYRLVTDNPIKIVTTRTTPPGTYNMRLTYTTDSGLQRFTDYQVIVDPTPVALPNGPKVPLPPVPGEDTFRSNMVLYGRKHCSADEANLWEGYVWYYDGARVYYQIADATGDPSFAQCAGMFARFYRDYVVQNNGGLPGWRVFPHGLSMHYRRAGDSVSAQAVSMLVSSPNIAYLVYPDWTREVSFALSTMLAADALTGGANPDRELYASVLIGYLEEFFINNTAKPQPFMVGLATEALIEYWERTGDPRVPHAVKLAADSLWERSWTNCFPYIDFPSNTSSCAPDLHLLIAPMYGWLYSMTHNPVYQTRGDSIFSSGVYGAWLDGGKQFSQSYRWGGKYLEWRAR